MKKIGLYGGSFDPVHLGHLLVAQAAVEELGLDRLFFIPARNRRSSRKPARVRRDPPATAPARACWQTNYEVDELEIQRGGVSYTVDTLREYTRRFPGAEIFYLIGADNVAKLNEWHDSAELAKLAEFVAVPRLGGATAVFPPPFRGRTLKGFPIDISSSQIRARIKAGLPVENLVPPFVTAAIHSARLYVRKKNPASGSKPFTTPRLTIPS
ncbi:MAG: nicotinate (nicotinamide) nucleotide adenylyltransferase [Limisphaerales bacterium]